MDLAWLETFLAVARAGSFTAAAHEVHLSQPGASRQVQRLESELGVKLMERSGGVVRLTPAGERVRAYAEEVLARHRGLMRELQEGDRVLGGELRIAASTTPGEFLAPELIAAFVGRYPRVYPQLFIADTEEVAAAIRAGRWDVGFVGARLSEQGLRYVEIGEDEVVLAVPAGHPFAARETIELHELEEEPFLDREGGSGTAASVRRALAARDRSLPPHRTVMVLGSTQAIVSAVERGLGIGWVSSLALAGRRPDRVAAVRLAGLPVRRKLWLITDARRPLPPPAAAFVEAARANGLDLTAGVEGRSIGGGATGPSRREMV